MMFLELKANSVRPNIYQIIYDAQKAGWKDKKIASTILGDFEAVFGKVERDLVELRLLEKPIEEYAKDGPSILTMESL